MEENDNVDDNNENGKVRQVQSHPIEIKQEESDVSDASST